jgi:hypothetical protein
VLVLVLVLVLVRRCWCAGETLPLFLDGAFTFWLLTTFHEQGGRRRIDQEREREIERPRPQFYRHHLSPQVGPRRTRRTRSVCSTRMIKKEAVSLWSAGVMLFNILPLGGGARSYSIHFSLA